MVASLNTPVSRRSTARRRTRSHIHTHILFLLLAGLSSCGGGAVPSFLGLRPRQRAVEPHEPPPPSPQLQAAQAVVTPQLSSQYYGLVALAGAISCSATHAAVVPLDVIKTALQSNPSLGGPRAAIAQLASTCKGPLCVAPFFNGLGATALGYFVQGATKFGGYEYCKRKTLGALREAGDAGEAIARNFQLPIMIGSAACAEIVASAALCPLEVLKLRMQTSPELAARGLQGAALKIIRTDGVAALFKGFVPIAMRQVPYTACKLVSFEVGIAALSQLVAANRERLRRAGHTLPDPPRTAIVLTAGLLAGGAAAVVSQPFDLLLTRLCGAATVTELAECVIADSAKEQLKYLMVRPRTRAMHARLFSSPSAPAVTSLLPLPVCCAVLCAQSLGTEAFSGLAPRLAMVSIMTSCQFFLYDSLRSALNCPPPPAAVVVPG